MNPNQSPPADLPPPDPDGWQPDPVLHAKRQEMLRRIRETGQKPTADETEGLWDDEPDPEGEVEAFLKWREERRAEQRAIEQARGPERKNW